MKPLSSGIKPLCDTCNRNNYPCRCPRASHEIVIACQDYILAHGVKVPVNSAECQITAEADKQQTQTTDW
ncbi:hypothetical protein [Dehalogenimonas etheniformans]|uniref:hypothetical protein n=1 Tax=Dehalogenimonas etheniformans TaxID=1536648 RepID=UPI000C83B0C5|nr:hypothetical protein [Dehalogenimonas etheniformans]QNT75202.1 hypothetical protein HX448_00085 [Dehalogenimonas etheniformans]